MKQILFLLMISIAIVSCKNENEFLIAKGQLGKITKATKVGELDAIFRNDSLVSHLDKDNFADSPYDEYLVYDKQSGHMLTIIPKTQNDTTSTIESIQIFDKKYKTVTGLNIGSTFKDIIDNYNINKVESTFTTAVLFVDELDATITIDKKELGIKDFGTQKISKDQIPDLAKIKTFTLWFD